jgi:Uma2 family endonuclease
VVSLLVYFLVQWTRGAGSGHVLGSSYKVRVSEHRGVMPDVQYFTPDNFRRAGRIALEQGRPDMVVEVVSPSSRRYDRVMKLHWYASLGVPEYWIVDPEARSLERLVLDGDTYRIADSLSDDAVFVPPSFEGLSIPLVELWDPGERA